MSCASPERGCGRAAAAASRGTSGTAAPDNICGKSASARAGPSAARRPRGTYQPFRPVRRIRLIARALHEAMLVEARDMILQQDQPRLPALEIEPAQHLEFVAFDIDRHQVDRPRRVAPRSARWSSVSTFTSMARSGAHAGDREIADRTTRTAPRHAASSSARHARARSRRPRTPWPCALAATRSQVPAAARPECRSSRLARDARFANPSSDRWRRPRRKSPCGVSAKNSRTSGTSSSGLNTAGTAGSIVRVSALRRRARALDDIASSNDRAPDSTSITSPP